jgi:hypothetical protein
MYLQYLLITKAMLRVPFVFINFCARTTPSSIDTEHNLLRSRARFVLANRPTEHG